MQDSAEPAGSALTRCQRGDVVVRPTPAALLTPPGLADSGTSAAGVWSALPARACVPVCPRSALARHPLLSAKKTPF